MARLGRLKVEMEMISKSPPPGIHCWQEEESAEVIHVQMTGPEGSAYEKGVFQLEVTLSDRYPFTPPMVKFITPIYHPNIDDKGRICLTALKPKPSGTWSVTLNIAIILSAIRVLLSEPNLSDPLMTDIATEFRDDYAKYRNKAAEWTRKHAIKSLGGTEKMES